MTESENSVAVARKFIETMDALIVDFTRISSKFHDFFA